MPNVVKMAIDCEKFGAEGITVHPRPDERHIKYNDVLELKSVVTIHTTINKSIFSIFTPSVVIWQRYFTMRSQLFLFHKRSVRFSKMPSADR